MIYFVPAYWGDYEFPFGIQVLGWLLLFSSVIMVPVGMIYAFVRNSGCGKDLLDATPDFCPAHLRQKQQDKRGGQVNGAYVITAAPELISHL